MTISRTAQAIALIEQGISQAEACRRVGVGASAVSKKMKSNSENAARICPCCTQIIRKGIAVNQDVMNAITALQRRG